MSLSFKRTRPQTIHLELAPLIDVIFQLLIFFLISSSFLYPSLNITLPKVEAPDRADHQQELVLSVGKTGECFINGQAVQETLLSSRLKAELAQSPRKSVFFHADNTVPYQKVLELMSVANQAGAQQLNFMYEDTD